MSTPTWKVMVFFAGQNHLAEDMVYSLKDMKSVGSDDGLTLLAQYSAKWVWKRKAPPTELPTPLRFSFSPDVGKWVVSDYVEPRYSDRPFEHYVDELADFILWGIGYEYKATDRYMVILSGDGGGPVGTFLPSPAEPAKKLQPFDLHRVFQKVWKEIGRKIDVVGLDSCLMSTGEIGFELRKYANFLVSSQGNEDDIGWPYRDILRRLKAPQSPEPRSLVEQTVDSYNSYYIDYAMIAKSSANLSGLNLAGFDKLSRALRAFVTAANAILPAREDYEKKKPSRNQEIFAKLLMRAHWVAQTYRDDQYTDLYDFCDMLIEEISLLQKAKSRGRFNLSDVVQACEDIKSILCGTGDCSDSTGAQVVVKSCYVGAKYQYSRGLSLYFPWNRVNEAYAPYLRGRRSASTNDYPQQSLPRVTGWGEFLDRYLCATCRSTRPGFSGTPPRFKQFMRDPPEGRGDRSECETAKNPSLNWEIASCIVDPLKSL